jgi:hypothetical protein
MERKLHCWIDDGTCCILEYRTHYKILATRSVVPLAAVSGDKVPMVKMKKKEILSDATNNKGVFSSTILDTGTNQAGTCYVQQLINHHDVCRQLLEWVVILR